MFKWVQSGLSAVAGTAEPEYGREAIRPITDGLEGKKTWRETVESDFNWLAPQGTNVETQTFYFTCLKNGYVGFAQVIHSNVMGIQTTAQFTFRLFNKDKPENNTWTSTKLEDFVIKGSNFYASNLSIELADNEQYVLKSHVNPDSIVELTVTRLVSGVLFGADGTTYYGDDAENPWGSMRHIFWPRCDVKGFVKLGEVQVDIEGYTMFVMALQGMKPHHAASTWNFLNFHSDKYSAVQMEFTTPKSYADTRVTVGIISCNDKLLTCSIDNQVIHEQVEIDEIGWPIPKSINFKYNGNEAIATDEQIAAGEAKIVTGSVKGELTTLVERVDVMAEIPQFVKTIVSGVAGTKPYIYQYCNPMSIEVNDDGKEDSDTGITFSEVTFILV